MLKSIISDVGKDFRSKARIKDYELVLKDNQGHCNIVEHFLPSDVNRDLTEDLASRPGPRSRRRAQGQIGP